MANILIADSDPALRQLIARTLQDAGHTLFQADDGPQTLALLRSTPIHAILADQALPGSEAEDLILQIRKVRPQAPVILFSDTAEKNPDRLMDAGAFSVLSKPFAIDEVRRAVDDALPAPIRALLEAAMLRTEEPPPAPPPEPEKRPLWPFAVSGLMVLILAGSGGWLWKKKHEPRPAPPVGPVGIYSVAGDHLSGVVQAGDTLWTCDWFGQNIRSHRLDAVLSLERSVFLKKMHPSALAWDGKNLWSASAWEKKISRHSPGETLAPNLEIAVPWPEVSGLATDGSTFWACDGREGKILRFRIEKGKPVVTLAGSSPGQKPVGLAVLGETLWSADGRTGLIYRHRNEPGFPVAEVFRTPDELKGEKLSCFSYDGTAFWIGTASQKIFRVLPAHLKSTAVSQNPPAAAAH
jgi:CheY-like chemotaxis protein